MAEGWGGAVSDCDARAFVMRCLSPYPEDWERCLSVTIEHAYQGKPSLILFALVGSPVFGHAMLYPYAGKLEFMPDRSESYILKIQRCTGTNPRRTRDALKIAMFLQVARAEAASKGGIFQAVDHTQV
jgi:hypothetical protein